jgi:lysozyme
MKPRHQVSRAAIELIKRFEGYRSKAARLADGRWTIGYGHTQTAREGAEVSEKDAEALLMYDLIAVARTVNEQVFTPLTQNQFDALCAFAFNIGLDNFRRSAVLRRINQGALLQAACAMELWRKAEFEGEPMVIDALVRRRAAEKALFLTPPGGFVPVPTPVLPPGVDLDSDGRIPREPPAKVVAPLDGAFAAAQWEGSSQPEFREVEETEGPAQAAAAALGARFAALFPEPEEAAAPPEAPEIPANDPEPTDAERPPEPEPEPEPPPAEPPVEPEPEPRQEPPAPETEEPPLTFTQGAEPAMEPEPDFPPALHVAPPAADFDASEAPAEPERRSYLPLVGLSAFGAIVFVIGVVWAVSALGGPNEGLVFGWLVSLVGLVVLGRAAYLFLERLGQVGDFDDEDRD